MEDSGDVGVRRNVVFGLRDGVEVFVVGVGVGVAAAEEAVGDGDSDEEEAEELPAAAEEAGVKRLRWLRREERQ